MSSANEKAPLSDAEILSEAIRLVASGVSVTFPVNGNSMLPFIVGGRDSLVLMKPDSVKVGDVVLAFVENSRYVIHRVERIDGEKVTLMGDGNLLLREHCLLFDVKAIATHVVKETGFKCPLDGPRYRLAVKLWIMCLPVRRWLLKFYFVMRKIQNRGR